VTVRTRLDELARRYGRWTTPRVDGLPNLRVLLVPPAALLLLAGIAVALGLNGFSSGAFHPELSSGPDPQLLLGQPRDIRTDEWYVQTSWAIAQVEQGLPVENQTFPGGMDATLPQDLPRADWTVAFRPHLLGFLVFDVDHAFSVKWWALVVGLLVAAYWFFVSLLPRRPGVAVMLALAAYFSPIIQWWFLATTTWPIAWAFAIMAALIWATRARGIGRAVSAGIGGVLTVVMAMGIYVPYIVPCVIVAVGFAVGWLVQEVRGGLRLRSLLGRLVPLVVAEAVAVALTLVWLASKADTVTAFLSTEYPGERLTPPGSAGVMGAVQLLAFPFSEALASGGVLGANSSEASTVFLAGAFLLPVVVWLVVREARARHPLPWALIATSAALLLLFAYLFIPGWDALAQLTLLDRGTVNRVRLGVGLGSLVVAVLLVRELELRGLRAPRLLAALGAGAFLLSGIAIAVAMFVVVPSVYQFLPWWWLLLILGTVAVWAFARRRIVLAAATTLLVTLAAAAWVNPVYVGVLDLRETPVAQEVEAVDDADPGVWVGMGGRLTTAVLLESGVEAYNGFQGAPDPGLWDEIDPDDEFSFQWNRLAGVSWTTGSGEPTVSNPAPDQILVTFDACADFAQANVDYVLSDLPAAAADPCLDGRASFEVASGDLTVYEVIDSPSR
jgi:hypothetical protein